MGGATPTLALPRQGGGNRRSSPVEGEGIAAPSPLCGGRAGPVPAEGLGWAAPPPPSPSPVKGEGIDAPPPSRGRESTLLPRRGRGNRRSFPPLRGKSAAAHECDRPRPRLADAGVEEQYRARGVSRRHCPSLVKACMPLAALERPPSAGLRPIALVQDRGSSPSPSRWATLPLD